MQPETQTLETFAQNVETAEDFERFLHRFAESLRYEADVWENTDLEGFLEGLRGFFADRAGYYQRAQPETDPDEPSWRTFADLLLAARVYE